MRESITRAAALAALRKYNHEPFHIQHALTVEGVMRWYAQQLGYGDEADFWATVGLLHDIDFEQWPEQHCQKAPELLREAGCGDDLIRAVCSHGYGICCDIEPTHQMEKVLYAADELTGLIGAAALMRPSKSCQDMEVKSLKKKYKDKKFAAGCSRDVIQQGADRLGWTLEELMEKTILAMRSCEASINEAMAALDLPEDGVLSASFLGSVLLDLTGRAGESPWFDFLSSLRRIAPVVQKKTYILADGSVLPQRILNEQTDEASMELKDAVRKWRCWSYYKLKYADVG